MVISDTRNINLSLPRSWNECTTEQLELISRIILEQIDRADRYHPFDMRNVKIACFFLFSGMEIVEGPDVSRPIEEQCYVCRFSSKPLGKRGRSWFRRRGQHRKDNAPFPVYLWQINYWLSPKAKTDDRQSVEYKSAGAGLLHPSPPKQRTLAAPPHGVHWRSDRHGRIFLATISLCRRPHGAIHHACQQPDSHEADGKVHGGAAISAGPQRERGSRHVSRHHLQSPHLVP